MYNAMLGKKTRILTPDKYLQNQYMSYKFKSYAPKLGQGRGNFLCVLDDVPKGTRADTAPCTKGYECTYIRVPGCPFYDQLRAADRAYVSVLNYPFYLLESKYGYFRSDLLICDEGHKIDKQILNIETVELTDDDLNTIVDLGYSLPEPGNGNLLKERVDIIELASSLSNTIRTLEEQEGPIDLGKKVEAILNLAETLTVVQDYKFTPVLPAYFTPDTIRNVARQVVLMSATIFGADYWADRLGYDHEETEYIEIPSTFPPERRPIWIRPICLMGMRWWNRPEDQDKMIKAIDQVIKENIPRKGLIHSVSYRLTDWILSNSMFAGSGYLFLGRTQEDIDHWKRSKVGVLVSPRASEGLDLPDELCEFIIIPKIPYLNLADPVVKVQKEVVPGFYEYEAISTVIQSAGRGMRHKDDKCQTYILDRAWFYLYPKVEPILPAWFKQAVRRY